MTSSPMTSRNAALCGIFVFSLLQAAAMTPAAAAETSAWDRSGYSSMRLIGGSKTSGEPVQRAGIELEVKKGWKTYWRYPGDSGVPPSFDFSASDNVADVKLEWPAPEAFPDGSGGTAIGYKESVVFPLTVTAKDPRAPVILRVSSQYAVCEKLCVPAAGAAQLVLPGAASSQDKVLAEAQARVPQHAKQGAATPLAVQSVRVEKGVGKPRVVVDINAAPHDIIALFVEGPSAQWALPLPAPLPGAPEKRQRFAFLLDGVPKSAPTTGAVLRFTAVGEKHAVETQAPLD